MNVEPVTLNGAKIILEPMLPEHIDELSAVGTAPELWAYTVSQVHDRDAMAKYVADALTDQEKGTALPFVTRLADSYKIVGSTRFGNIDKSNRKVEIGWTWVTPEWQKSFVNTEAKLLLLTHAFEIWKCIRVEFKTDAINLRSRNAILRIGAKEEGTLRQHMITDSGRFRDSVYFSILDSEWDIVRSRLINRINDSTG